MKYKLQELLDIPKLRELLHSFDEIHSMPSAIIDTEGNVLIANSWQDICTKFHRMNPETEKRCIESDTHIQARLDDKIPHVVYHCPMGLVDSATPLIIEGEHIGNVFTGQLFIEPPDEAHFIEQARRFSFDEADYLAAMRKVPFFTEEKLHKNLNFIHALAQMLAEQGLQFLRQREAEAALRESEAVFRRLFEDMNDPTLLLKGGRFIDCNASTLRILGYESKEEFQNCSPSDISPEFQSDGRKSAEKADDVIATAYQKGYHRFEWTHKRADGSTIPVEVTLTPITVEGEVMLHTLWRDITELKQAENILLEQNEALISVQESLLNQNDHLMATEEMLRVQIMEYEATMKRLKESEERFQALLEASFGGIVIHDRGVILDCNQGLADMTGYSMEELVGMDGLRLIAPESLDMVIANIKSGYSQRYEVVGVCKDGSRYPLAIRGKNSRYKGRDARVIEFRDITDQKHSEHNLKLALAEAQRFRDAIDSFPSCVYMKDTRFRYVYANRLTLEYFGCSHEELVGSGDERFFPTESIHRLREVDMRVLAGEHTAEEIVIQDADGGKRVFWEVKSPLYADEEKRSIWGMCGISTDITERKRTEDELLKIEKLESLGVLAGGIAHDFNNILTGVMGNISYAQMLLESGHRSHKPLVEAEKASVRATELAHQLLTFARGGEPVKKVFSIRQLLNDAVSFVLHGSNVKGSAEIPESLHAIDADEGQIGQVFHNIIINAAQAMSGGGTLTVSALNRQLVPGNRLSLSPGNYICLIFADQGCGIPDEVMKRIFDPYFTTKSAGNGLGLASARSIINRHGGSIEVVSVIGSGTTFTIYLPSIGETLNSYNSHSAPQSAGTHSGGSILIMDDELIIREMTAEMLEFFGYEVATCEDGAEAVCRYRDAMTSGKTYSAVVMDLTVPGGMGGRETAEQILALDPKACLIVSSGYSNDPIMSDYKSFGFAGAVAKPYNMRDFGQLIGSLLTTD